MKYRVLAVVEDILFASKIRAAAEAAGAEFARARSLESALDSARSVRPGVVIVDLHAEGFDPFALAESFKSDQELGGVPLVGYFSHVQAELRARALGSGFDRALPRSRFVSELESMLQGGISSSG
jgi:PleD family two-component response regulator